MVDFKGAHFEKDTILTCVRWYVAYPLSYRQLEEMMQERGVAAGRRQEPCHPQSLAVDLGGR